jgi:hypothetical protein
VPNITDVQVTAELVTLIQTAAPDAKVYPYIRYAIDDSDWATLFTNDSGLVYAWMVTRVGEDPSIDDFAHVEMYLDTWQILGVRGIVDTGVYETSSAAIFQAAFNTVKLAINADPALGFGICNVSHRALKATNIKDGLFSGRVCHIADCRLAVELWNV